MNADPERKSGRFLDRVHPLHLVSSESASVWAVIGIRSCYSISRQQYHHATGHRPNHFVLVTPPPVKHNPRYPQPLGWGMIIGTRGLA